MYQVSNAYRTALEKPVRQYHIRIAVGNKVLTDDNIREGTFFVTNQCSDETQLQIGQVFVGELGATFCNTNIGRYDWKDKELTPYFGLVLGDGTVEYVPLGYYKISTAEWSAEGVKVTAYDRMTRFDAGCSLAIKKTSLYILASLACSACNVELGTTKAEFLAFPNGQQEINTYDENDISTWRDVIYWVAQSSATFATMGRDGKLYFRKYNQNVVDAIDDRGRYEGASFSDFHTRYTGISVVDIKAKYTRYYGMPADDALTYNLGSNPLLQFDADETRERCCRAILTAMQAINYVPFSVTAKCNPAYDLGDVLRFENGLADDNAICCITKYTLNFHGGFQMSGSGEDPRLANGLSKTDKNLEGLMSQTEYNESLTRSTERRYYDYVNDYQITASDGGDRVKFSDINYKAGYGARLEYRAEVKLTCTQTDSINQDGYYVENDAVVRVFYKDLGEWRTDYYPVDILPGGVCLLHLLYVWTAPAYQTDDRNFQAFFTITGGNVIVEIGDVHSYVTTSGELQSDGGQGGKNPMIYIEVNTPPTKQEYGVGESLNYSGLVIAGVYEDGSRVDVTRNCTYNPAEYSTASTVGTLKVNVSHTNTDGTFSTGFDLEVVANMLESIDVTVEPTKASYLAGETLDYSGLVITAYYTDGTEADVTSSCTFSPSEGSTVSGDADTITVDVSYTEDGVTATTDFDLEVQEAVVTLSKIEVTKMPTKKTYAVGEQLVYDGVEITATYSDGSAKKVTNNCTFNPQDGDTVQQSGEINVQVSYTENQVTKTTQFALNHDPVKDIIITKMPTTMIYKVDQETKATLDFTGIEIHANTQAGNMIDVTSECTFSPNAGTEYTNQQTGQKTVTVTYQCQDGTFTKDFVIRVVASNQNTTLVGSSTIRNRISSEYDLGSVVSITMSPLPNIEGGSLLVGKYPTKTSYILGESIDYAGIEMWVEFENANAFECTNQCEFNPAQGYVFDEPGIIQATVTLSYGGSVLTTTFPIEVKDA